MKRSFLFYLGAAILLLSSVAFLPAPSPQASSNVVMFNGVGNFTFPTSNSIIFVTGGDPAKLLDAPLSPLKTYMAVMTLPPAAGIAGRQYTIKHAFAPVVPPAIDYNVYVLNLDREIFWDTGNFFVEGYQLIKGEAITVVSDGQKWQPIGRYYGK